MFSIHSSIVNGFLCVYNRDESRSTWIEIQNDLTLPKYIHKHSEIAMMVCYFFLFFAFGSMMVVLPKTQWIQFTKIYRFVGKSETKIGFKRDNKNVRKSVSMGWTKQMGKNCCKWHKIAALFGTKYLICSLNKTKHTRTRSSFLPTLLIMSGGPGIFLPRCKQKIS